MMLLVCAVLLSACDAPAWENPVTNVPATVQPPAPSHPAATGATAGNARKDHGAPPDERTTSREAAPEATLEAVPKDAAHLVPEIVEAHNRLGYLLFADLVNEAAAKTSTAHGASGSGNVVISPISVALALGLTHHGAAGETATAMAQAMQLGALGETGMPLERLSASHRALIDSLTDAAATGDIRLQVANALWHRKHLSLLADFAVAGKRYYRAEVLGLDFAAPDSVEQINAWANEATQGLVPKIVDELPGDLAVLIANAVYFQGHWQTPFDPGLTRPLSFHLPSGARVDVKSMYRSGSIEYYQGDFQAVRLPYGQSGRIAMYLFLPPEDETIQAFAGRFQDVAAESFGNFRAYEGEVWLPRLDVSFKSSLNEPLKRLGMAVAFDPAQADFSRMIAGARPGDLSIGDVLHQAVLKLDETGTEAAAVTSIEVRLTSAPVRRFSFRADRPFLLAIRDDETGALLFTGAIVDPRG